MTAFLSIFFVAWIAFFGAAVGSFLNVVIWRVPEGMSLVTPPSHCPKCGARIRWYDNVPIFGWILLGGKCRDCRAPISARYPGVEFLCCSLATIFAFATLL
ncbi:MAG: prepilin peptidase, partial [Thermoguttaceae bacterium]|nr:prepilin peptidase [Thermoguttaceae bacterium]